jgi:hypothetical protein
MMHLDSLMLLVSHSNRLFATNQQRTTLMPPQSTAMVSDGKIVDHRKSSSLLNRCNQPIESDDAYVRCAFGHQTPQLGVGRIGMVAGDNDVGR